MARKAKKRRYSKSSGNDVKSEMRRYKKGAARVVAVVRAARSRAATRPL
jgi:hypothetical protein